MISVKNIYKDFGKLRVLNAVSCEIKDGEKVVASLYGKVFNLPVIEKDGYDFVGWKNDKGDFVSKFFINEENKDVTLYAVYEPNTLYNGREATRPLVISPGDDDKVFAISPIRTTYVTLSGYGEEAYYDLIFNKGSRGLEVHVTKGRGYPDKYFSNGYCKITYEKCSFPSGTTEIYFTCLYGAPSAIEFSVKTIKI